MLPEAPAEVPPELRAAITDAFPELTESRFSVAGRGWHSLAIDIDGRFIAKFPQGADAEKALLREARLLAAVRPHVSLPVPDMQLVEHPVVFSMHRKLAGSTLLRADYECLSEVAKTALADKLAQFFAELHVIDPAHMRATGAGPVEWWDVRAETLAPVWAQLPAPVAELAEAVWRDYVARIWPDEVYGFFDAHGWNMAFDHKAQRLNGIFDFADSGFGPVAREFVPVSLISLDLARRAMAAYEMRTGRHVRTSDVYLLTAAARLSEFAGAIETGEHVDTMRDLVIDWFAPTAWHRPAAGP
ncbi:phosphotransferase [Aliihoeflea aestuarii]|jgi:Ser/Thr protein kinase RdoA (MazF antagonist)|uniref:phosphotransferase family protein n=1 Tax=Aliihoeflea aestuarii TaxID=453840 RepID=UPI00209364A8|nr:aminoglycoside phosphotransferase family protein [Aliihoeflea aestuarii]MCO6391887.1 phosphotransferase [Aliihoeflea aestuarii]